MPLRKATRDHLFIAMAVAAVILAASCYLNYYGEPRGFIYDVNMYLHIIPFGLGYGGSPVIYIYFYYALLFVLFTAIGFLFFSQLNKKGKS